MSTNSSNITIPEREVGWQATPQTRGTADILWSCMSIIILITWTSFHPTVGIKWTQRIPTTIMATLLPQLTALVAARDRLLASRLTHAFKHWANRPEWGDEWTHTKSLLVVKRGIRVIQHSSYSSSGSAESADITPDETTNRRHSRDSNSEQSMDITSDDEITDTETNGTHSIDSNSAESVDVARYEIVDIETFLLLAVTGRIRYEDFPTTEQINDKSKADWFSKCATLAQLFWFLANMVCRGIDSGCTVSVMEILVLDWIMLGFIAAWLWWKCPQNVNTPYTIQVQDYPMSTEAAPVDRHAELAMGVLSGSIPRLPPFGTDPVLYDPEPRRPKFRRALMLQTICGRITIQAFYSLLFADTYQWHSSQPKIFWMIFTWSNAVSEVILLFADIEMRFDWTIMSIYKTLTRPSAPGPPPVRGEDRSGNVWLTLGRVLGTYDVPKALEEKWQIARLKLVAGAALVSLLCHLGKVVVALTAFISAPKSIYNVPDFPILEALGHVGG